MYHLNLYSNLGQFPLELPVGYGKGALFEPHNYLWILFGLFEAAVMISSRRQESAVVLPYGKAREAGSLGLTNV